MSFMNWVAYQPAPLGLANFDGRLGFDSAWLLFESALRAERYLQWSHLRIAEIAIRALALGWILRRLLLEFANGWHAKSIICLSALIVLSAFIFQPSDTSSDMSANLLAFCAWVIFCKLMLLDASERPINGGRDLSLLLILIALAVTFKLSVLPIALLPAMLMLRMSRTDLGVLLLTQRNLLFIIVVYCILWLARNFILTGCIVYPIDVTCASVPWGVGAADARLQAAWITGWARHPGADALDFVGILNTEWIASWFKGVRGSIALELVAAAVLFILLSSVLVRHRNRSHHFENSCVLVRASTVCATGGLVFWFLSAPDLRFSWAFFAIISATIMFHGFCKFDYGPPKIGFMPLTMRKSVIWSLILAVAATIIQLRVGYLVPVTAPTPPSEIVTISGDWQFYMPTAGDACWDLFPCTTGDFGAKTVERWSNRLFFRSNVGQGEL